MPLAEKFLWFRLRANSMLPFGFVRGSRLGSHDVDFYSPALRCALEIRCRDHPTQRTPLEELKRSIYFAQRRIRLIQLSPNQIFDDIDGVIALINQSARAKKFQAQRSTNLLQPSLYAIKPFHVATPHQHPA